MVIKYLDAIDARFGHIYLARPAVDRDTNRVGRSAVRIGEGPLRGKIPIVIKNIHLVIHFISYIDKSSRIHRDPTGSPKLALGAQLCHGIPLGIENPDLTVRIIRHVKIPLSRYKISRDPPWLETKVPGIQRQAGGEGWRRCRNRCAGSRGGAHRSRGWNWIW